MTCKIVCNQCELDRRLEDCTNAHKRARDHEARYDDHWVTVLNPPEDSSDTVTRSGY